jgi:hypothetical protein
VPERIVGGPVDPRECLPLIQQRAEPVHPAPPVVAQGERLGLGDHALLRLPGGLELLGPLRLALLALFGEERRERVQALDEAGQVTHGIRRRDRGTHRVDAVSGFLG